MRTQEKAKTSFSKKQIFRTMASIAPNQDGDALDNRGFTMVELLVVCAIIGVLAMMAIPAFSSIREMAKVARCKSEIRGLELSINGYNLDHGSLPAALDVSVSTNLTDPWGRAYVYYKKIQPDSDPGAYLDTSAGHDLNTDFDLYSLGADGVTTKSVGDPGSMDDIVRGADGAVVAEVKNYGS
jgi:general secretion pathway protein G